MPPTSTKIAVLANKGARKVTKTVLRRLSSVFGNDHLFISSNLNEAEQACRDIVAAGYSFAVIAGGDGTLFNFATNLVAGARQIDRRSLPAIIATRLGTGNALALMLETPAYYDLAERIHAGSYKRKKLRFVDTNGQLSSFVDSGWGAEVLSNYQIVKPIANRLPGSDVPLYFFAGFGLTIWHHLLVPKATVTISCKGPLYRHDIRTDKLVLVDRNDEAAFFQGQYNFCGMATSPNYGFGFTVFPLVARGIDGINLRVSDLGLNRLIANFKNIWNGCFFDESIHDFVASSFDLNFDRKVAIQIGGDVVEKTDHLHCSLSPLQLDCVDFTI